MKQIIFPIALAIFCAANITLIAQEQKAVTKTISIQSDGDEVIIINGKDIKMNAEDGTFTIDAADLMQQNETSTTKSSTKSVSVNVEMEQDNDETIRTVTIDIVQDGERERIKWEDDGENVPDDIQRKLEEYEITLDILDDESHSEQETQDVIVINTVDNGQDQDREVSVNVDKEVKNGQTKRKVAITITKDGEDDLIEWEDDGEIPTDIQKILDEKDISIEILNDSDRDQGSTQIMDWDGGALLDNKAMLGVSIADNNDEGIKILNVFDDSGAKAAGLIAGDIIQKVDGTQVNDMEALLGQLSNKFVGDVAELVIIRNGEEHSKDVIMSETKLSKEHIFEGDQTQEITVKVVDSKSTASCNDMQIIANNDIASLFKTAKSTDGDVMIFMDKQNVQTQWEDDSTDVVDRKKLDELSALKLDGFKMFPNPSDDQVTISFSGKKQPIVVQILDAAGRSVYNEFVNDFTGEYSKTIESSRFGKGNYFVYIIQDQKAKTESLVIN